MSGHDHLIAMLNRLKLTALRDQLDSLISKEQPAGQSQTPQASVSSSRRNRAAQWRLAEHLCGVAPKRGTHLTEIVRCRLHVAQQRDQAPLKVSCAIANSLCCHLQRCQHRRQFLCSRGQPIRRQACVADQLLHLLALQAGQVGGIDSLLRGAQKARCLLQNLMHIATRQLGAEISEEPVQAAAGLVEIQPAQLGLLCRVLHLHEGAGHRVYIGCLRLQGTAWAG